MLKLSKANYLKAVDDSARRYLRQGGEYDSNKASFKGWLIPDMFYNGDTRISARMLASRSLLDENVELDLLNSIQYMSNIGRTGIHGRKPIRPAEVLPDTRIRMTLSTIDRLEKFGVSVSSPQLYLLSDKEIDRADTIAENLISSGDLEAGEQAAVLERMAAYKDSIEDAYYEEIMQIVETSPVIMELNNLTFDPGFVSNTSMGTFVSPNQLRVDNIRSLLEGQNPEDPILIPPHIAWAATNRHDIHAGRMSEFTCGMVAKVKVRTELGDGTGQTGFVDLTDTILSRTGRTFLCCIEFYENPSIGLGTSVIKENVPVINKFFLLEVG